MNYENPTPVVVALIPIQMEGGTHLLTVRRAIAPFIGEFAFPGGFVDKMESAEDAIVREVLEECNLQTDREYWRPVCTKITPKNQLLIFLKYGPVLPLDTLFYFSANAEVTELGTANTLDRLCFSLHQEVLETPALWR